MVVLAAGCGGSNESAGEQPSAESTAAAANTTTASSTTTPAIVGRWKRVNKCPELVKALDEAGLGAIAPSVVGDYFPEVPPKQLAQKDDLCAGAKPIVHYHFFDEDGRFGSLDEHEEQVDDGTYEIIDDRTFVISKEFPDTTFHYRIEGDTMTLSPVVTRAMKREALAHPLEFTVAGWGERGELPRSRMEAG
ncbi:MAG: hypothetical protein H0V20_07355 [Actinobacteria bacterium]|nr:hypothetical protein [Actinomycetota bacterium]